MKRFLRSSILIVIFSNLLVTAQLVRADSTSVGDPGQSWSIPNDADRGMHVQQFIDSSPGESSSFLLDNGLRQNKMIDPTCKSVDDERCTSSELQFSALLPICGPISSVYCIEEFGIIGQDGTRTPATFSRYFPNKALNEFAPNTSLKVPFGATGSIFNLPEASHAGGDSYYVSVLVEGGVNKTSGVTGSPRFSIRINPVMLKTGDGAIQEIDTGWSREVSGGSGHAVGEWRLAGFGFSGSSFCVAGSAIERLCAQRYAFPGGKKFYLKARLQVQPGGWMHGRIYRPEISLNKTSEYYTLDVSALPVAVPVVYKMYRYPEMPQALKDQYDYRTGLYKPIADGLSEAEKARIVTGGCGRSACSEDPLTRNVINSPGPSEVMGMRQLKIWIPFVDDKATALLGTWSMRTLEPYELEGSSKCFSQSDAGITGIVTTNATQYSGSPPTFNKDEQLLEYQVAAPHLTPRNEVFLGSYDLLMRSDVARCVYGFSSAPIRASLSIVSDGKDQQVATEALGEKDGWVYLSAQGFTYSDPIIRVKLTQDPPAPSPTPTPTPTLAPVSQVTPTPTPTPVITQGTSTKTAQSSKKTTITCSKSGKIKRVTAVKPKCPTGFKRV